MTKIERSAPTLNPSLDTRSVNGYVYFASNPSMPGLLKIGKTRIDPESRTRELHTTGVPTPFRMELALEVTDPDEAELVCHETLSRWRVEINREFFEISLLDAAQEVVPVLDDYIVSAIGALYVDAIREWVIRRKREKIDYAKRMFPKKVCAVRTRLVGLDLEVSDLREKLAEKKKALRNLADWESIGVRYLELRNEISEIEKLFLEKQRLANIANQELVSLHHSDLYRYYEIGIEDNDTRQS